MEILNNMLVFTAPKIVKIKLDHIAGFAHCLYLTMKFLFFKFKSISYFEMYDNYFQNAELLKGHRYYSAELLRVQQIKKNR